jgi:hypothetical protein
MVPFSGTGSLTFIPQDGHAPSGESIGDCGIRKRASQSSWGLAIGRSTGDAIELMAPTSTSTPIGLAIAASVSLAAILVLAGVSAAKVLSNDALPAGRSAANEFGSASNAPAPRNLGQRTISKDPDWGARLWDSKCEDACIGGVACNATGNKPCPSKFTCIPGSKEDVLDVNMLLELHVASLVSQDSNVNLCNAELSVCLTPFSTQTSTCIPISDPCRHEGRSTIGVPVVARDLVSDGIGITIRSGSKKTDLATGTIRYGTPIRRVGLCSGFKFGGMTNAEGGSVKFVTFFVEPRSAKR